MFGCVFVCFSLFLLHAECAICGWDTVWYNTGAPSPATNFTDTEIPPNVTAINSVCDASAGGMLKVRCRHDNAQPFEMIHNDTSGHFTATCTAITGLKCWPWTDGTNSSCPDYALQLGCECRNTKAPGTVGESLSTSSGNQHGSGTTLSPNGKTNLNVPATSPTPGNRGGATNSPTTDRANVSQHGSLTSQRAANGGVLSTFLTGNVIAVSSTRPGGLFDSPTTRSIFSNASTNGTDSSGKLAGSNLVNNFMNTSTQHNGLGFTKGVVSNNRNDCTTNCPGNGFSVVSPQIFLNVVMLILRFHI